MESKVYLPNGARVAPFATNVHVMCDIAPDGAIMAATHKTKGAFEGAEGAICLNGSSGSPKSSFSCMCVRHQLQNYTLLCSQIIFYSQCHTKQRILFFNHVSKIKTEGI